MPTAIVLGGVGAVGRVAARTLALTDTFDKVVIGDIDFEGAKALAVEYGPGVSAVEVDVSKPQSVREAIEGADVVINCTGPFYKFAVPVLEAVIDAAIPYVDVCDDVDATLALLDMDEKVKSAGIVALIGMGNSPGVTNLLGRLAVEHLLDETLAVDIYHAHGGEAFEGAGVVAHRLHGMTMDIPMYLDGALKTVKFFGDDGVALRTNVKLLLIGDDVPVYPYPHPEQITMPRFLNLQRVTNRGTVLPDDYFLLTTEMARLGLTRQEPLTVGGVHVSPRDFAISYLLERRNQILKDMDFGSQRGCMMVEATGIRHGKPRSYRFSMASTDQALGEGTGIPAAIGAMMIQQGAITAKGVLPPEGAVEPMAFLAMVPTVLATRSGEGSFKGLIVEKIDENGNSELVDLPI